MSEFAKHLLAEGALFGLLLAAFAQLAKSWVEASIKRHFDEHFQQSAALLEIEKTKQLNLVEARCSVYPELLELAYRLRNRLRELRQIIEVNGMKEVQLWDSDSKSALSRFGEELYLLTERLYKYRGVLDEPSFEVLHRYKRKLQDAQVTLDRTTRPDAGLLESISLYQRLWPALGLVAEEIDQLYPQILANLKAQMASARLGEPAA